MAGVPLLRDARRHAWLAIRVDAGAGGEEAAGRATAAATRPPRRAVIAVRSAAAWPPSALVLLKFDAVRRGIRGELVARFERRGLTLRGARLLEKISRQLAGEHYAEHKEAVLRRPRLVHHLGPDDGARDRGRVGDLGRPGDDGRDDPLDFRA